MSDPSASSPEEARAAELLARWLDGPATPEAADAVWAEVREGLEPEVLEAVVALRPELAPAPQLDLDALLDGLTEGPLQPVSAEEAAAAAALADWLDSPAGDIPEDGLDDDVLESLHALRPERAAAPSLDLDALLDTVSTGPLAAGGAAATGAPTMGAATTVEDGSALADEPAPVVDLAAARAARMPRWMLPGAGLIAVAATALLVVLPTADEAMQGAPAAEAPAHMDEARPAPAPSAMKMKKRKAAADTGLAASAKPQLAVAPSADAPPAAPAKRASSAALPEAEPVTRADRGQEASREAAPRQDNSARQGRAEEAQNTESKADDQLSALGYISGGGAGAEDRSSAGSSSAGSSSSAAPSGGLIAPSGAQADAWDLADADAEGEPPLDAPPPPPPAPSAGPAPAPTTSAKSAGSTAPTTGGDFGTAQATASDDLADEPAEPAEAEEQRAPASEPAGRAYSASAELAELDEESVADDTLAKDQAPPAELERSVPRRSRDRRGSRRPQAAAAPSAPPPPAPVPTALSAAHPELVPTWSQADQALAAGNTATHRALLAPLLSHPDADVAVDAAVRLATVAMDRGALAQAQTDLAAVAGRQPGPVQAARYRVARRTLDSMNSPLQLDAADPPITNTTEYE